MPDPTFDLDAVIKRRGFIWPSFEIYGGNAGFYDYGPLGTSLKNNIISVWRKYFVTREGFAEIDTPNLTPHEVFRASGHLEKFNDLMLECTSCKALFKADSLFSEHHPEITRTVTIDAMRALELDDLVAKEEVRCPDCGGEFKGSYEFNLMFRTTIGGDRAAYLHPETAQGIFVNFQNLLGYFRNKIPFGAVTIGKGFRNEISPRQGLIRLREFNMAEAEVFIDPEEKDFPGFEEVRDTEFTLLDQHGAFHLLTSGEAVSEGIICHPALAYYMAITQNFLLEIGIDPGKLRFRQHQQDEMAHYAEDCWDAEIQMDINGKESWIECVGVANRSCYDLEQHMKATGQDLRAFHLFDEPVEEEVERIKPDLALIGRTFKADAPKVNECLMSLIPPFPETITLELDGKDIEIAVEMYDVEKRIEKVSGRRYFPTVIEPSFGIDRILYAVLQHAFHVGKERDGVDSESYNLLKLLSGIAPIQAAVFPLFNKAAMKDMARSIADQLSDHGYSAVLDDSGSIGKRYARMDEVGTPYCITVDHQSLEDGTVTIRDRDSTRQKRIDTTAIPELLGNLLSGSVAFPDL